MKTLQERAAEQKSKIEYLETLKTKKHALDKLEVPGRYSTDMPTRLRVAAVLVNDKNEVVQWFNHGWHPVSQLRGQLQNSIDHAIRVTEIEIQKLENDGKINL